MSKAERETGRRGAFVCPDCERPVDLTIKGRHKTLGVYVPVWGPGPCRNPDCHATRTERKEAPQAHPAEHRTDTLRSSR